MRESPVFVRMFEFLTWVIPLSTTFPREQRFVVAEALQRTALAGHEALIRAGMSASPASTSDHLNEVATQLALTRFYIRLSHSLGLLTLKQYEHATERLDEISRLVQAWRRISASKANTTNTAGNQTPISNTTNEAVPGVPLA